MTSSGTSNERAFFTRGWCRFAHDPVLAQWVQRTLGAARKAVADPQHSHWLRCGSTWFAGVNALPNDVSGAVENGMAVAGRAHDFIRVTLALTGFTWDPAQVSVIYPGYPQPMDSESAAAYRYRRERDAAHLDGLLREGAKKRRRLCEHHAFILGIPMVEASADASPFVVWEGSHEIVRHAFREFFRGTPADEWQTVDVTELYHATRRQIFADCRRVTIPARPGEAYLVHRLALHGIAPWGASASAGPDGRMIAYFRPDIGGPERWLTMP